ncbi:hypothetical protein JOE48_000514 [Methylobacterium sp. PvR107]|nr:hypothetical protein [Methylobacterium sp. PvR107]
MEPDLSTWSSAIRRDPHVRRCAMSVAWAVSELIASGTAGEDDRALAVRTGVKLSTAKNGLSQLRRAGYLDCSWTHIDGRRVRVLRPTLPVLRHDIDQSLDGPGPVADTPVCLDSRYSPRPAADTPVYPDSRYNPEVDAEAPLILPAHAPEPSSNDSDEKPADWTPSHTKPRRAPFVWELSSTAQERRARPRATHFVDQLYWRVSQLRCSHDACGIRASIVCGEGGEPFCQDHRGYAQYPVVLSSLLA